jgi:hypothetical protein
MGAGVLTRNAEAQGIPIGPPQQRFQISAWGVMGEGAARQPERGCYMVDTVTGELWYSVNYANPKKISEKLR